MYYSYANTIKASFRYMIFLVPDYDRSYSMECYCPTSQLHYRHRTPLPNTAAFYCTVVLCIIMYL